MSSRWSSFRPNGSITSHLLHLCAAPGGFCRCLSASSLLLSLPSHPTAAAVPCLNPPPSRWSSDCSKAHGTIDIATGRAQGAPCSCRRPMAPSDLQAQPLVAELDDQGEDDRFHQECSAVSESNLRLAAQRRELARLEEQRRPAANHDPLRPPRSCVGTSPQTWGQAPRRPKSEGHRRGGSQQPPAQETCRTRHTSRAQERRRPVGIDSASRTASFGFIT